MPSYPSSRTPGEAREVLKKPGEYLYAGMDDDPLGSGGYTLSRGRLPYGELGREFSFEDLPEGCKNLVLDMYLKTWNL